MTEPTTPTETVVTALAAVMAALPSIPKADKAPEGAGGYQYRGIEALTREIQPLLAKHQIVIVPTATVTDVRPCPGMREGWHDVHLSVEWRIYHQHPDDVLVARTNGIGRDNSDKGANKAQTQAFKYLLLHLLCIADRKDDADGATYEEGRSEPAAPAEPTITEEQAVAIRDRIATIPDEEARKVCRKLFVKKFGTGAAQLPSSRLDEAHEWLDGYTPKTDPVPLPDDGRTLIEETIAGATDSDTVRTEFVERYGPIEELTTATADAAVAWLVNRLTVEKLEPAKKAAAKKAVRRRAGNRRASPEPTPVADALTDAIGGES